MPQARRARLPASNAKMTDIVMTVPYLPVRPDWLVCHQEPIVEPDLPIVDCHHHLWDRPGWRYLFDELNADLKSGHNIHSTVFVECQSMRRADGPVEMRPIGETEFVNGVAAMSASGQYGSTRVAAGIVGWADLTLGERVQPLLEAHLHVAGERFRGIRNIASWDATSGLINPRHPAPRHLLADKQFRLGFSRLAPLGLSFDVWLYHPQLNDIVDLARAFPETKIAVNHVGGPLGIGPYRGMRDEIFVEWKESIRGLASCPNVCIKLGGLGMRFGGFGFHDQPIPPSSEQLANTFRPYIESCIEAFGASRCMFESNFPVDKGSYSYAVVWNAFKHLARGASPAEKSDLFSGTAVRFYRLVPPN
jgi:predicted TIM-barrel fold metal-dependent hydrolase